MGFISFEFIAMVLVLCAVYYCMPLKYRWIVLFAGSICYYYRCSGALVLLLAATTLVTWWVGRRIGFTDGAKKENRKAGKFWCTVGILVLLIPLVYVKYAGFLAGLLHISFSTEHIIVPIGISFYTLQMIAYLVDIYRGKYEAESNVLKFMLFSMFFPQILQGPIPRYEALAGQLWKGHRFEGKEISRAVQLYVWGCFLKLVIADKAGIVVDTVFGDTRYYTGVFCLVAGILYSVQLYTDFLACVCMAKGTAGMFGIQLGDNFAHPYFADSIKDFWRRWHISLSSWLRDYIYIPLGGNRKGKIRRYMNLMITFLVSGLWHGAGFSYIFWGFLHGFYQIAGEVTQPVRRRIRILFGFERLADQEMNGDLQKGYVWVQRIITFMLVMFGWIIFRAPSLRDGLHMVRSVFTVPNFWVWFDGSLLQLGLGATEWIVLLIGCGVLLLVSLIQTRICIRDRIAECHILLRWALYAAVILGIVIFGTYGYGFDANSFIYGGF
ncbi:MAG: MBOAT family O-acyltransferase [Lachnospiraceae bacterium]|nr:MBOAT family O-acyltransferase [Lachnospiraceae bacterium]